MYFSDSSLVGATSIKHYKDLKFKWDGDCRKLGRKSQSHLIIKFYASWHNLSY